MGFSSKPMTNAIAMPLATCARSTNTFSPCASRPEAAAEHPAMPRWRLAALALYPLLVYLSLYLGRPGLRSLCLPLLALLFLPLLPGRAGRLLLMSAAVALAALAVLVPSLALWPPSLIFTMVGLWFATTLRHGCTPVIER